MAKETDAELFQKAQQQKREKHLEEFKKAFNIGAAVTLASISEMPEALGALDTFIHGLEHELEDEAADFVGDGDGAY